jgi:hypothetical protein
VRVVVCKREGAKVIQSEEVGKSTNSQERYNAALPRDCRDNTDHSQTNIPCTLQERPREESCYAEDTGRQGSRRSLSICPGWRAHCSSCTDHSAYESSISKDSSGLRGHSFCARTCHSEVASILPSIERHRRRRSELYRCHRRRST